MNYLALALFCLWVLTRALGAQSEEGPKPFADRLVEAARFRTTQEVRYDPAYVVIAYPGGDVPADTGVCTDVVIRSYRALGIDLQKLVHEDMRAEFGAYPKQWGLKRPDKNIDHRRVPNLETFFRRQGAEVTGPEKGRFLPGDLVTWDLNGKGLWHIGMVVGEDSFVHNIGAGPELSTGIGQWKVIGHFRFHP
ncbi:MAG: DUF1287 domain-containing protein [Verrucomicrobiae bacterium]|nr:DUF1287 domain-containing protein [Verrucomicrobiae bacterium]